MQTRKTILTGIKPTGMPHLGNYLGAIGPAINLAKENPQAHTCYFVANYHALTTLHDAKTFHDYTYQVAATWLALGLDPQQSTLFRQSDIPEVFELTWALACFTSKGLMNRAHAYKALVAQNLERNEDPDHGINIGLYTYPILMAADILLFDSDLVPVGVDQLQHLEMARDIAQCFNSNFKKEILKLPQPLLPKEGAQVMGLDGRKMSKSYNNTIPLFLPSNQLRKLIMKIATDSSGPTDPKDPDQSTLFSLYSHFAAPADIKTMRERYASGIGWGEVKQELFGLLDQHLAGPRQIYEELMANPARIEEILSAGALRARPIAQKVLARVRQTIGC